MWALAYGCAARVNKIKEHPAFDHVVQQAVRRNGEGEVVCLFFFSLPSH